MSVASASAQHRPGRRSSRIISQSFGVALNIALIGLSILWMMLALDYMGGSTIGRGAYRYLPEIQVAVVATILAMTIAGLLFAVLSLTVLEQARIYWWRAAAGSVVISAVALSYFLNSSGNIIRGSDDLNDFPAVSSGIAICVSLVWLALVGLSIRHSSVKSGTTAVSTDKADLNAKWLRRFYLACGAIFFVVGTITTLISIGTNGRLVDGGPAFPNYSMHMVAMSLASLASGLAMLFFGRAASKNQALFRQAWWLPPAAALVVCCYVLYGMDPATYNVGSLVGPGTTFLTTYLVTSAVGAAFCLVWLMSGVWLQWRASQKRESVWAFAASAAALTAMVSTVELSSRLGAVGSGPVATKSDAPSEVQPSRPAPAPTVDAKSGQREEKKDPNAALKAEWATLETSEDEAALKAFSSRAEGTPYADTARKRLAAIQDRKAKAAAPVPATSETSDRLTSLRDEWSTLAESNDRRRLIGFISRAQGTPYAELARARLEGLKPGETVATPEPEADTIGDLRSAWVGLSTSNDEKALTAFISRARGTQFEADARARLDQLQPGKAAASNAPPAAAANTQPHAPSAELAEAWKSVQDTTSQAVLEAFISRSAGSIYQVLAQARLQEVKLQARRAEEAQKAEEQRAADERATAEREAAERAAAAAQRQSAPEAPAVEAPPTCDSLWYQRNALFHQYGYCFQKDKALTVFGNAGCFRNQNEAWDAMGESNRQKINRIRELESRMKC